MFPPHVKLEFSVDVLSFKSYFLLEIIGPVVGGLASQSVIFKSASS